MPAKHKPLLAVALLLTGSIPSADFDVTGRFMYEDRPFNVSGFVGGTVNAPIRSADVQVVDVTGGANSILANGATDASGNFTISGVVATQTMDIEIRCLAYSSQTAGLNVAVRDSPLMPTNGAIWTISATYANHGKDTGIDFSATPTIAKVHDTTSAPAEGDGPGGAFNIFEQCIRGSLFVKTLNGTAPSDVKAHWEPGVDTGTSYFSNGRLTILGSDADRDEYDDTVVLHELGHGVEFEFWQARSPGGSHGFYGHVDPRLALSEGYANYFSSAVRNEDFYVDMNAGGIANDHSLETGGRYNYNAFGSDLEVTVQMALWDISDASDDDNDCLSAGHDEIWDVFDNYMNAATLAKTFEDFHEGWRARGHMNTDDLDQIMNGRVLEFMKTGNARIFENDFADVAIPDNNPTGVTRTIDVPDDLTINSIAGVTPKHQSFSICAYVELDHSQPGELQLTLSSPDGTSVLLYDSTTDPGPNPSFSRTGLYTWFGLTTGGLEQGANAWLRPEESLTAFDGKSLKGSWSLKVVDTTAAETGTFRAWKLMVVPADWYDAPNSYGTGVRHKNSLYEWLGTTASHEAGVNDPLDTDSRDNHDLLNTDAGDDGVVIVGDFLAGGQAVGSFVVTTTGAKDARYLDPGDPTGATKRLLYVRGWFDWDQSGTFEDPAERMVDWSQSPVDWDPCDVASGAGFQFSVPGDAKGGVAWARFRLSYDTPPLPTGAQDFGEVEDYTANFVYSTWYLIGQPQDGTVSFTIGGVPLAVPTLATSTADDVAVNIASAINANSTLASYGIDAIPSASSVSTNGTVADFQITPGTTLCHYHTAQQTFPSFPRNGSGVNFAGFSELSSPRIGQAWVANIDVQSQGAVASAVTLGLGGPSSGIPFSFGELLVLPPLVNFTALGGLHTVPIANDCSLVGSPFSIQGSAIRVNPFQIMLNNAIDITIGY